MKWCAPLFVICLSFLVVVTEAEPRRKGKLFPIFQIVTFPNDPCSGSNSRNGTCYTAAECSSRGGTNSGSCANSFGVCCTFTATCGGMSSENCTYFTPPTTVTSGTCQLRICPCGTNICQLRLDFNRFVITGPSTLTATVSRALFNSLSPSAAARTVTNVGQCLTDTFSVTNPTGSAPPVICGTNTNQHMYVDSTTTCNDLVFQFGANAMGAAIPSSRDWEIKVTQYDCNFNNLAPDGCVQYFYGATTGQVQTYNYAGAQHLANQDQIICVRRERGLCRICWSATANIDFMVSGVIDGVGTNNPAACCNYDGGNDITGYDCVEIPGAVQFPAPANQRLNSRFCGRSEGLAPGGTAATVCSTTAPFFIRFVSDTYENGVVGTAVALTANTPALPAVTSANIESGTGNGLGARLGYFMDATNCS